VGDEAIDGRLAGVGGVEDLGQEGEQGDARGVDALAAAAAEVAEGLVDLLGGEAVGEGEAGPCDEVAAGVGDLAGDGAGASMAHGRLPPEGVVGATPSV
jgi:hypothetical protein